MTVAPSGDLYTYTIYDRPADYPDAVVVRRWRITPGQPVDSGVWCLALDIDSARKSIPPGLVCMERQPDDDPTIVETWL